MKHKHRYTPNKITEFLLENYILYPEEDDKPGIVYDARLVPVVQRVILKEIVGATIDSGCRIVWVNSY